MHDEEPSECRAEILYHSREITAFSYDSTTAGTAHSSSVFVLGGYYGVYWLVNINDHTLAFIDEPLDPESTAEDLQEMEDIDEYTAEELAEIIKKITVCDYQLSFSASKPIPAR